MRQPEPQLTLALTTEGAAPFHQLKVHTKAPQPPTLIFTSRCSRPASRACLELPAMFRNRYVSLSVVAAAVAVAGTALRCAAASRRAVMFARRVRTGQARTCTVGS
jgi:hypothetical protein